MIPNVIGHMGCRHGCGSDKLLFDMSGYVQFGDLPPIRIGHYKDFLPYKNMQETVSYGVAKILGKELRRTEYLLQKESDLRIKDKRAVLQHLHEEKELRAGQVCDCESGVKEYCMLPFMTGCSAESCVRRGASREPGLLSTLPG